MKLFNGGWPFNHPPNCHFTINEQSPQARGLVAWWPTLGSRSANTLRDFSGYGRHGTLTGDVSWTTNGEIGPVIDYPGTDDYVATVDCNAFSANTTGQLTVTAWCKPDVTNARQCPIGKGTGSNYEWELRLNNDGYWQVYFFTAGGGVFLSTNSGGTYTTDLQFFTFTVDIDAPRLTAYRNAIAETPDTSSSGSYTNGTAAVTIGARSDLANDFNGTIGECRIYNRALSDAEVYSLYANPWELYRPVVPLYIGMAEVEAARRIFITHW